jgi:ATP-dependent exoDNAse (exonuclease V) beta subunit
LAISELALATANNHKTEEDYAHALNELDRAMNDLLSFKNATPAARKKILSLKDQWPPLKRRLQEIPSPNSLADFCRAIEDFRKLRPTARGPFSEQIQTLDALIWEKELSGSIPQICFDVFARNSALEIINVLSRIDERLNEEKHKLSALDFDDLQLRALALIEHPEVAARTSERYKFFLVDEFQDTNSLQKLLLERLALGRGSQDANLFIVGDQKQSIYGFRGADVDVFQQMTQRLLEIGGESRPLRLNFRSQPPLIDFFNLLFERVFEPAQECPRSELDQLGYVSHERSESKRELTRTGPLVELLITSKGLINDPQRSELTLRELDANQLAIRIHSLHELDGFSYSDIALLFRAMTQVGVYESAFRRANIPYQTVLGRGFYERPEITDLIQLLRFLDNRTDELALAAVLRSPLCGISDNALLALRCAPRQTELQSDGNSPRFQTPRSLYRALKTHSEIRFISDDEHDLLERAASLLQQLVARRHHYSLEDLLRFAVERSEFMTVVAANFDGAQRLANVERLFTLAARFEASGTHLIRDFVSYVEEFEAIGSRESEGLIDEAANAVRLMTIHQAKGLEFPVVVLPDLNRQTKTVSDSWFSLDRHCGLTLKVPDGRGKSVAGSTCARFVQRQSWREHFENMRLLYVAATRAEDRLLLSGATVDLAQLQTRNDSWLTWIWQALELSQTETEVLRLTDNVELQLTINLQDTSIPSPDIREFEESKGDGGESLREVFPLLGPVAAQQNGPGHRFSVTQLINYQRCARQYYFDRVLKLPSADELAVWNNAEAQEPPANLTATLKGAVIHRFCERYSRAEDVENCVRESFAEVVRLRQAELADRMGEIDAEAAIKDLLPLATNYLKSNVFARIEEARAYLDKQSASPTTGPGLWSELPFKLRRPLGVLSGTIDKLLISVSVAGELEIEIIDFKTNRIGSRATGRRSQSLKLEPVLPPCNLSPRTRQTQLDQPAQLTFNFEDPASATLTLTQVDDSSEAAVRLVAQDYQLQMQAYALAVRQLTPSLTSNAMQVTLHFLEPNVEFHLPAELLGEDACRAAIDDAMQRLVTSSLPEHYPAKPQTHCRMCNFLSMCRSGRDWLRSNTGSADT